MKFQVDAGGRTRNIEIRKTSGGMHVTIDGREHPVDVARVGNTWSLILGPVDPVSGSATGAAGPAPPDEGAAGRRTGRSYEISIVEQASGELVVHVNGQPVPVSVADQRRGRSGHRRDAGADVKHGPQRVVAPMPGRIVKVLVKAGDVVAARQGLVIVEAMKMENELRSPKAGTVAEVRVAEGASVEANAILIVVE